ncbi:MAG: ATP synthase F1 subunit delta [Patescibacteria group bacterium]
MSFNRLIKEIAQALVAEAADQTSDIVAEAQVLEQMFAADHSLVASLDEASIPLETRRAALRNALKTSANPLLINALLMLHAAKLLKHFDQFFVALLDAAETSANHREVMVTSSQPLNKTEREDLQAALKKKFGGTQRVHENVDPGILGGLIVKVGDWTYDASLKSKINRLKQNLCA